MIKRLQSMLRNLFRRNDVERDLDAEVHSYSSLLEEEKLAKGVKPEIAMREARMEIGGADQLKEEVRSVRAGAWLESLWRDIRFAVRLLRRNPGFTVIAVFTLALGVGANSAVFSVVNAVVLRPLPYKDAERLVVVRTNTAMFPGLALGNSWVAIDQMRKEAPAFEHVTGYRTSEMNLTQSGDPARLSVIRVVDNFFGVFGAGRQLGRLLVEADQTENQGHVVVLSDALWRNHFGADDGVIGRTIILDKTDYTIVGVASRGFVYPLKTDLWTPLLLTAEERQNIVSFSTQVVAKLRAGQSVGQAQAQVSSIASNISKAHPALSGGFDLRISTLLERRIGNIRSTYLMLFGAAGFVLLIACANLASLLLARGWGRQREMALRAALGASRERIMRQTLVESCLLGLLGGAVGLVLASLGIDLFRHVAPASMPRLNEVSADSSVFWFALACSLFAGILFGFAPAMSASRTDPNIALNQGASGSVTGLGSARQPRLSGALVVTEVALAFILLIGAVVTAKGLMDLLSTDAGFRTEHLLTLDLPLTSRPSDDPIVLQTRINDVLARVRSLPGVLDAAATDRVFLGGSIYMTTGFTVEGPVRPLTPTESSAQVRYVSPTLLQMLGIRLIRGRYFNDHDLPNSQKVLIVNEAMARRLWGTLDVVGKRVQLKNNEKDPNEWTVVAGVVADVRDVDIGAPPEPQFYFPIFQSNSESAHLMIRTAQDPSAIASLVSRQVWLVDKDQPITGIATMDQLIRERVGNPRMRAALLSFFGAIGLGLALLGVYGVVAYSVARRTREIGIRMALGANRFNVLIMVIRQGFVLSLAGVALGVGGALALAQVMKNEFEGANPADAATYFAAGALVVAVACLACYVPARRAMRVDPMVALRYE